MSPGVRCADVTRAAIQRQRQPGRRLKAVIHQLGHLMRDHYDGQRLPLPARPHRRPAPPGEPAVRAGTRVASRDQVSQSPPGLDGVGPQLAPQARDVDLDCVPLDGVVKSVETIFQHLLGQDPAPRRQQCVKQRPFARGQTYLCVIAEQAGPGPVYPQPSQRLSVAGSPEARRP